MTLSQNDYTSQSFYLTEANLNGIICQVLRERLILALIILVILYFLKEIRTIIYPGIQSSTDLENHLDIAETHQPHVLETDVTK
jgi:hypothetical protein